MRSTGGRALLFVEGFSNHNENVSWATAVPGKVYPKWHEPMRRDVARYVSETRSCAAHRFSVVSRAPSLRPSSVPVGIHLRRNNDGVDYGLLFKTINCQITAITNFRSPDDPIPRSP